MPHCRSPRCRTTPPPSGSRWAPAPAPAPGHRPPPRPSGASGPCSTTPSATPSSCGSWPPTRSTGSSGKPPPSPRPSTGASSPAPPRPATLLAAVRALSDRGAHLEAFYACLYYAALRPSEAVMLRESDCHLPGRRWGRIDLAASAPRAGRDWTDDGTARQARGLKHRAQHETRSIPIPPVLVQILRAHLKRYGTSPGRADLPHRTRRHHPGQRLQRRLGRRPRRRPHPRPARLPAGPPPLRPAPRRRLPVAELRRPRHRSRPPRRAQRRRPAQDLRPLHRRAGRRRQQAHRRRPRQHPGQPGWPATLTSAPGHGHRPCPAWPAAAPSPGTPARLSLPAPPRSGGGATRSILRCSCRTRSRTRPAPPR